MMIVPGSGFVPKARIPGVDYDPYWANVNLLMRFDNNVDDASGKHNPVSSGVTYESGTFAQRVVCTAGDTIDVPASTNFASDDVFTLEFRLTSTTSANSVWFFNATSTPGIGSGLWHFVLNSGGILGQLTFSYVGAAFQVGFLGSGTEHHVAVTLNSSGTINGYLDGIKSAFSLASVPPSSTAQKLEIATSSYFGGSVGFKMDELRYTKGVARYTANFTPPTAPFPNS